LIGKAGSAKQDECEGANQKAEQIKPPMRRSSDNIADRAATSPAVRSV
jgi:hypothetical protein